MGWAAAKNLPTDCWLRAPQRTNGSILILGQGGSAFWQQYSESASPPADDPLDRFSLNVTDNLLASVFSCERAALFPAPDCELNLMRLLAAVGWQRPSPLGLGINARFGLWSAVRAVWWLDRAPALPKHPTIPAPDLCATCESQACVDSCPAGALASGQGPDLGRCADHRFSEGSACAANCLARRACPVAPEHQYGEQQMAHHYRLDGSLMAQFRGTKGA